MDNVCECGNTTCGCSVNSGIKERQEYDEDYMTPEALGIQMTLAWCDRIAEPPTQEEFQKQLEYFITLLTNKQMNG